MSINIPVLRQKSNTNTFRALVEKHIGMSLSVYTKTGRRTKTVDGMLDRLLDSKKNFVNRAMKAIAESKNQKFSASKDGVDQYDAARGIVAGDLDLGLTDEDLITFSRNVQNAIGKERITYNPDDVRDVIGMLLERYASDERGQSYIKLEQLTEKEIAETVIEFEVVEESETAPAVVEKSVLETIMDTASA